MAFSLDNYINENKKKQRPQSWSQGGRELVRDARTPFERERDWSSSGVVTGEKRDVQSVINHYLPPSPKEQKGFSLDNYIVGRSIRSGGAQQQDNDFLTWNDSVGDFSRRMNDDYTRRAGTYQNPTVFQQYRDKTGGEIAGLLKQAYASRGYYTQYGGAYDEVYGPGSSKKFLDGINQNIDYLEGVREGIREESDFWGRYKSEDDYNDYIRQETIIKPMIDHYLPAQSQSEPEADMVSGLDARPVGGGYDSLSSNDLFYGMGNINLGRRPMLMDGENIATVRSMSFEEDGKEILVPTVIPKDGKWQIVSNEEAIQHYHDTGEYLGKFDSVDAANAYADQIHRDQEAAMMADYQKYGESGPPSSKAIQAQIDILDGKRNDILAELADVVGYSMYPSSEEQKKLDREAAELLGQIRALEKAHEAATKWENEELRTLGWRDATVWDLLGVSARRGAVNSQYGIQSNRAMMGQENEAEKYKEMLDGEEFRFIIDGPLQTAVSGGAELAGQQWTQYTDPRTLTMAGGGAVAGGMYGAAFGGGLGTPLTAPVGAGIGALAGFQAGSTVINYEIESGLAYNEMIENGVEPELARGVAMIVGGVNAGIEYLQVDDLIKSTKILSKAGMGTAAQRILTYLGSRAKGIANDVLQEDLQEGATIAGTQLSKFYQTGEWAYTVDEVVDRIKDNTYSSALSFLAFSAPGAVRNITHISTEGHANAQIGTQLHEMDAEQAVLSEGLQSGENTESYKLATMLQQKVDQGKSLTNEELGALYKANVIAVADEATVASVTYDENGKTADERAQEQSEATTEADQTDVEGLLLEAAGQMVREGKVTNSMAERILSDQEAIDALTEAAGIKIDRAMTKSQQRAAVKSAVETYASRTDTQRTVPSTENQAEASTKTQEKTDAKRSGTATVEGLGKYGTSAFEAMTREVTSQTRAQSIREGFTRYYDAGTVGLTFKQAFTEYGRDMTEEQQISAYVAGRNDAALTLKERKAAAQFATVHGKESGFIPNEYSRKLPHTTVQVLNTMGKALGVKIQMTDTIMKGRANGSLENGIITIAKDAANPVLEVALHEITHELETLTPGSYRRFRDYAVSALAVNNTTGIDMVSARIAHYAEQGVTLTREGAMNEIAADLAGKLLTDRGTIRRFIQSDRTLAGRFFDAVRRVAEKIKRVFPGKSDRAQAQAEHAAQEATGLSLDQLNEAVKLWEAAMKDAEAQAKKNELQMAQTSDTMGRKKYDLKGDGYSSEALTEEEHGALLQYKSSESYKINAKLRDGAELSEQEQRMVSALDSALSKLPVHSGEVYRKIVFDGFGGKEALDEFMELYSEDIPVFYNAYTSASTTIDGYPVGGKHTVKMIINSTTAKDMEGFGNNFESEVLFERGCEFMVEKVVYGEDGTPTIYLKEAENDGAGDNGQLYSEERGVAVRNVQKPHQKNVYLQGISKEDSGRDIVGESGPQQTLPGGQRDTVREENKYSLKDGGALEVEVARLNEINEYLRDQFKVSKVAKTDAKAVGSLASTLLREYGSSYDAAALRGELQGIYDYMASGKDKNGGEISWGTLKERALETARHILEEAQVLNDENAAEYKDLRKRLRSTGITISQRDQADLPGGFREFRKRNFGRLNLVTDGTAIDTFYGELVEEYGESLFPSEITHPADMLEHLAEMYTSLVPTMENPYAGDMGTAAEYLADDMIERFYEVPQKAPTFADKAQRRVDERAVRDKARYDKLRAEKSERISKLQEQGREKVQRTLQRERTRRVEQVEKLREHYKGKETATRERRSASELRAKIRRTFARLSTRLTNPTETSHVPEPLRGPLAEFMASVDLSSDRMGDTTLARLQELRDVYRQISEGKADLDMEIDPDLQDMMGELADTLKGKSVGEMNVGELTNLYHVIAAMSKTVTNYNRTFNDNLKATISDLGISAMAENEKGKDYQESAFRAKQAVADLVNMDMLAPTDFFEELGPTMQKLYGALREGLDTKIRNTKTAADYMTGLLKGADITKWTGKKAETTTFHTGDGDISLTPAQVMSLYLLFRQQQGQNHIFRGGIKAAPVVTLKDNGKGGGHIKVPTVSKSFDVVHITLEEASEIISSLSDDQVRIAEGISDFFTNTTAAWGNEVSMRLYGYKKFTVKQYFPIVSDKNYITQVYGEATDATLKNMGVTKQRMSVATNPIIIEDAFDVYTRQADKMGSYHAFVAPLTDIQRVWNYRSTKGQGSVKQSVERRLGRRAVNYFGKLVTDINGGMRSDQGSPLLNAAISRYKAARVGLNLRVILQQPTAYLRAAAMIDPKYLAKGAAMKTDWNKVLKYAPIAQWKDWGYFNLDTGRQMKDIFIGESNLSDKFMWAAGKADEIAWVRLWNACELQTEDQHPELRKGSEELYRETGRFFSEMIDRTQVVDSVFHRPQIMRNGDALVKMSTAFMSEPMKSYNLLRTAARNAKVNGDHKTRTQLVRTVGAYVACIVVNNIVTGLMDAYRDDGDDEEEEKFTEKWMAAFLDNMAGEIPSMFPIVKDVFSLIQGYDVKRMDMQGIDDLLAAAKRAMSDKYTVEFKVVDLLSKTGDLFGIPTSSIRRELEAMSGAIVDVVGDPVLAYEKEKLFYSIHSSDNTGKFYRILFKAWKLEDKTAYNAIYADMIANGFEADKIKKAMEKRMKDEQGVKRVDELESRYLTPEQEQSYDNIHGRVTSSPVWRSARAEQQKHLEEDLYDLTVENVAGSKLQEKIDAGANYGIDETDYLLYRLALEMADKPNDSGKLGTYTNDEVEAAIDMLTGLSKQERAYLWEAQGKNEKSNPYN